MEIINFRIQGISPLLMHSPRSLNPFDEIGRQIKEISGKRKKTDEDHEIMSRLGWESALYYSSDEGVVIPSNIIEASLVGAAKLSRSGPAAKRGLRCLGFQYVLEHEGPKKDKEKLFQTGKFIDIRPVRVNGKGVMRTRPIFEKWGLTFELAYDPDVWNKDDVIRLVETAGSQIGICDFRPRYGRFKVMNGAGK